MGFLATPLLLEEGDSRAQFDALAVQHWDRFFAFAYRHCGNTADAEDLLSESLLEAFQSFGAYQGHGFDRWMYRILTTNRIDQTRHAKRRPAVPLSEYTEPIAGGLNPQDQLLSPLLSEELQQALQKLPENFRVPLLLCELEGLDYASIATRLQVPIGTVRSRIHRARERLHQELRQFCHTKECPVCAKVARRRVRDSNR
ncbi:sigma-70 family RNA polymerase sigma factor [Armatimonas sp.]|uniref:RNA polymerase sigma factor n=1 Tax=Armatimonas sp. TaxID=1872638 RepID=UPI00286A3F4C|nr:sigma-70 family RNA polymerase sigma factor [Armatimonas sp.]